MKKNIASLLCLALVLSLAACFQPVNHDNGPAVNGDDPFAGNTMSLTEDGFFPLTLDEYVERFTADIEAMGYTVQISYSDIAFHHSTIEEGVKQITLGTRLGSRDAGISISMFFVPETNQVMYILGTYRSSYPHVPEETFDRAIEVFERLIISSGIRINRSEFESVLIATSFGDLPLIEFTGNILDFSAETVIRNIRYNNTFYVFTPDEHVHRLSMGNHQLIDMW